MRLLYAIESGLITAVVCTLVGLTSFPVKAECAALINGQPMTSFECRLAQQTYGYVEPGHYVADIFGNWKKIGEKRWRGNIWRDSQILRTRGAWGGGGGQQPKTPIDPKFGCESENCTNKFD